MFAFIIRLAFLLLLIGLVFFLVRKIYPQVVQQKTGRKPALTKNKLQDIFDKAPLEMAMTAMMIRLAQANGPLTLKEKEKIFEVITEKFSLSGSKATDLFKVSEQLSKQSHDVIHLFNCLSPGLNKKCSYLQKKQIYILLHDIATQESDEPSRLQQEALSALKEYLEIGIEFQETTL